MRNSIHFLHIGKGRKVGTASQLHPPFICLLKAAAPPLVLCNQCDNHDETQRFYHFYSTNHSACSPLKLRFIAAGARNAKEHLCSNASRVQVITSAAIFLGLLSKFKGWHSLVRAPQPCTSFVTSRLWLSCCLRAGCLALTEGSTSTCSGDLANHTVNSLQPKP